MRAATVVVLEDSNRIGAVLSAGVPLRDWVLASARDLEETQRELLRAGPAFLIAEYRPRFLESLAWVLEYRPEVRVIVVLQRQQKEHAHELIGLGVWVCLAEDDWPQLLPSLLGSVHADQAQPAWGRLQ
jgi:hypothetical protein